MRDKRFLRSEDAIIRSFLSIRDRISVDYLISRAQISRSTFYRHHKSIARIVLDYEDYLLDKYEKIIKKRKDGEGLRFYYKQLLIFIIANKKIVLFLVQHEKRDVLEELVLGLEPTIVRIVKLPKWAKTVLIVYRGEIVGLLEEWAKKGFIEEDLNKVLSNIVFLTVTMKDRLIKLEN